MKLSMNPVRPCTIRSPFLLHNQGFSPNSTHKITPKRHRTSIPILSLKSVQAPTKRLCQKWMDYQGISNWEGLLDPLEDTLREEIIRYGNFVEAAYKSYDFDPSSLTYGRCRHSKGKLLPRATGYQVSRHLRATSGIRVPRWMERAPGWMSTQSSWIGYVAVCNDKNEIARLGRRDVVVALRGTATCLEWLENLRATLTPLHENDSCGPMVESGFLSLYTSSTGTAQSLQSSIREEISRILKAYGDEPLSITISGHSLGAALAILAAYDIKQTFRNSPLVTVMSFGGPRVGNPSFRQHLEKNGTKVLRIVNSEDPVTRVPGFVIDNENDERIDSYKKSVSGWFQKLVEDTQWVYADVGCELRLSSRDSPYHNGINIAACHDLKTYLNLVSSNCPIRATAQKIIAKRMKQTTVAV
ncbi:unnamed protein product [Cuscuta epithymum]|uniref:Fungal lipase-type domain-containing protein n=1 Tax=Cuscuta epithymum TaxID=186058 RepID=A0AAV0EVB8_9ASTE|nr:unnamed protein product [Cuscuta epithymum]